MLDKALVFATEKHSGQIRKASKLPYITHPIDVAKLVTEYKTSKRIIELETAALLHDTLEDTDTTFEEIAKEFSPLVASLVLELTSDKELISKIGKLDYLKKKMLGMSSWGLYIKLCDRLSNLRDHPTEKTKIDTVEILNYLKTERKLSQSHLKVIFDIELCLIA